jgi:AMMECR1 domain-containing protein
VRSLLRFQRTLAKWSIPKRAPDATPFVSIYADGSLRGCFGSDEGPPGERLARAFFSALHDTRFGGVRSRERDRIAVQVSFVRDARLINPEGAADAIELGVHGVAVVPEGRPAVCLLPHVARDERVGAVELLRRLSRKAGLGDDGLAEHALYLFETDDVVVRGEHDRGDASDLEGVDAGRAWLASLVDRDGAVTFAIDPRGRKTTAVGEMHHARVAVVLQALEIDDAHRVVAARVHRRLLADVRGALRGESIAGWPTDDGRVAGTLALAVRAKVPLEGELRAFIASHDVARAPWHAAQVVAALGRDAPESVWRACVADLDVHPWAPWTAIAAHARGDRSTHDRAARALCDGIRRDAPHEGAGTITAIPEIALTALAVEALAAHPAGWARSAARRARDFVARTQLVGDRVYAALDPSLATGAFPASLVADGLRCDITAHAVLALNC